MADQTIFRKKDNSISSIRTKGPLSSTTYYPFSNRGGMTFKTGALTTRMTPYGVIGTGMKTGNHTTYFGKNGQMSGRMTSF